MPRPVTGRRPDSLFDNRFRYDFIYPRGRSGETLRAYDTQNGDAPVVIKRPALQDAPPIRAGQEQSILREKRALEMLSGHAVLTELRHVGTFRVGGQLHQYIVMDMAQGTTVEAMILSLAQRGERLPDLEMLVILDHFLDLLQTAHDKNILYNDVDAKHLFWDRDHYRLKLIDWGNAIFLDTDQQPHATRSTDIQQVGQLLYFLLSGGHRLDLGRAEAAMELPEPIPQRLKEIIAKAAHADANQRYNSITALRIDLSEVRRPLDRIRDMLVERARSRLPNAQNQSQLDEVRQLLQEALEHDPGYPEARELLAEAEVKLSALAIQADLDAVRIYIESGSYGRAINLIGELTARAGGDQPLLRYLRELSEELRDSNAATPAGLTSALEALFKNDPVTAARALVTTTELRPEPRLLQFRLAERLTHTIPGITLLRPHLIVLEDELSRYPDLNEARRSVETLLLRLDERATLGVQPLLLHYGRAGEEMAKLEPLIQGSTRLTTLLTQAQRACNDIVDLLDVVSQNALSDSTRAGNALWHAAAIDPVNPAFNTINDVLNFFHTELENLHRFVPQSDGSNIRDFLLQAQTKLGRYAAEISDPQYQELVRGVNESIRAWSQTIEHLAQGGRRPAADASRRAAESIRPLNPQTAQFFEDNARKIEEAQRIEYLSPNVALGRALADGWDAWDKGRGGEAQAAGERAMTAATTEGEKAAARRLIELGDALSSWLAGDGAASAERTDQTANRVTKMLTADEEGIRRRFNEQMPTMQTYLKAMSRGIIEPMRDSSAAAIRALFFDYVLRGILALGTEQFEEADFWREAASRALPGAKNHPAFQSLDSTITRRQLILEAVRVINNTRSPAQLVELRQAVRAPLAAPQLETMDQAVRALDEALRKLPDGEFRAARQYLDTAIERITQAEAQLGKDLGVFKTWLQDLAATAEVLAQHRRVIEQAALVPTDDPDPAVTEAHRKLVDLTRRDLGETYTAQLRQWRDTYEGIVNVYRDDTLTKDEKLRLFESHFAAMFIDRQPALPLYRHWQNVVRGQPDDPEPLAPSINVDSVTGNAPFAAAPPVSPRAARSYSRDTHDSDPVIVDVPEPDENDDDDENGRSVGGSAGVQYVPFERKTSPQGGIIPRLLTMGGIVVALVVIGTIFLLLRNRDGSTETPQLTLMAEATDANPQVAIVTEEAVTETALPPTETMLPTDTAVPTETLPPTATDTPTAVPTQAGFVPTPTVPVTATTPAPVTETPAVPTPLSSGILPGTPVTTVSAIIPPTAPPEAASGTYDLLDLLGTLSTEQITWDREWFMPVGSGSSYQLGNADTRRGTSPPIKFGTDVLTYLLGTDAPSYVKRIDATIVLNDYSPLLLQSNRVFFGIGLETALAPRLSAEARARLVTANALDLGTVLNGNFRKSTTVPVTTVSVRLSVERNADRTISMYYNGRLLGTSDDVFAVGSPLVVYLYTATGGIVATVTEFTVTIER